MPLVDTTDRLELALAVRRLVAERSPMKAVRNVAEEQLAFDPALWSALVEEMGISGLAIPEEAGGVAGDLFDVVTVLRELGAGLIPSPFFASTVLFAQTALELDATEPLRTCVARVANGDAIGSLAVSEPGGNEWFSRPPETVATGTAGAVVLNGTKQALLCGAEADVFLVYARGTKGAAGFYLVEAGATGVDVTADRGGIDLLGGTATVRFVDAPATALKGDVERAVRRAITVADLAIAAISVGATKRCIDMTADYAKIRFAFGHPIGAYQGVKHRLADRYLDWALADASLRRAAESSVEGGDVYRDSIAARLLGSAAYLEAARTTILLHGGIGYTWEHDAHLYYRNAVAMSVLFGGSAQQARRLADLLLAE